MNEPVLFSQPAADDYRRRRRPSVPPLSRILHRHHWQEEYDAEGDRSKVMNAWLLAFR
jgi:hypothetical protein